MPRRHDDLFGSIASFQALHAAARRAVRGKRAKPGAAAFMARLEPECLRLERELWRGEYRCGRYTEIVVRDPKRLLVSAAPFRDRVVRVDSQGVLQHRAGATGVVAHQVQAGPAYGRADLDLVRIEALSLFQVGFGLIQRAPRQTGQCQPLVHACVARRDGHSLTGFCAQFHPAVLARQAGQVQVPGVRVTGCQQRAAGAGSQLPAAHFQQGRHAGADPGVRKLRVRTRAIHAGCS